MMRKNNNQEKEAQKNATAALRLSSNYTINYLSIRKKWKTVRE